MAEKKKSLLDLIFKVKKSGEPTIVEMVKEQQLSNFFLEQIRDILLKGFNLDKKSYDEAKKSFIKQKFRRAEGDDEGDADPKPPKRKSIIERAGDAVKKFDPGLLTKLLGAGAFLFLLDNPGAIDYVVDGATRLIDFFKGMIDGIQSIYDAIVPYIPEFLTSNESVNKFVSDLSTDIAPYLVGFGAALLIFPKTTMKLLGFVFSIIGKTFSTVTGLFKTTEEDLSKSQKDITKKNKKRKFGFGKRFGKLAGLIGAGIAGVTAAMFVGAESDVNKATSDMDTRAKNTERAKNLSPEKKKLMTDAGYKVSDTGAITDSSGRNVKATEAAAALDNAEKGKVVSPRSSLSPSSAPAAPAPAASAAPTPAPAASAAPTPAPAPAAASPSPAKPAASAATAVAANDNAIKTASQSKSVVKSVGKVIGKFGIKAIPIVGALAGLGFALKNLSEGDYVGASAEGAGIFLPTLAGAPLDLGIAAREVYNDAYQRPDNKFPLEEDLIQDPQMVGDRMEEIYNEIKKQLPTNKENAKPRRNRRGGAARAQLRAQSQASQADAQVDSASSMEPGGPSASFAQVDSASSMEPSRPSASFQGPANENVEGQIIDAVSRTNVNQVTAPITVNNINNSTDASTSVKNENISGGPIDPVNRDTSLYIGARA